MSTKYDEGGFKHANHYVAGPGYINAHTHEFDYTGTHLDFQLVLPVSIKKANMILNELVQWALDRVDPIEEDVLYERIFSVPVKFVRRVETGREVMRVILPDANGDYEDSEDPRYAGQREAQV